MGKILLKINGLNLNRLLNTLNAKGVFIYDLDRSEYDRATFGVDNANFSVVKEHIKQNGLNYEIIGGSGLLYFLKTNWYRFGLLLGLIASVVAIYIATSYYWEVRVEVDSGNAEIVAEVNKILEEEGLVVGGQIKKIQTRDIERMMLERVEESALVVVTHEGVKLNIFIKEATKPESLSENGIVASFSGVIEQIDLSSGNLLVNIGDAVTKGELLISSGKVGDVFMEAHGSIIARVLVEGDSVGGLNKITTVRTGNYVEVVYIEAFGKKFYSSEMTEEQAEIQYVDFEVEKSEVALTQNNLLPIKKNVLRYYEISEKCVTISYEQLIEELSANAYTMAESRMPVGAESLSVSYKVVEDGSLYKVVCSIETRIDIAKRDENAKE